MDDAEKTKRLLARAMKLLHSCMYKDFTASEMGRVRDVFYKPIKNEFDRLEARDYFSE